MLCYVIPPLWNEEQLRLEHIDDIQCGDPLSRRRPLRLESRDSQALIKLCVYDVCSIL